MKSHKPITQETRLALLEQSIGHINETMLRIEKRFDKVDKKIDDGFEKVDKRLDKIESDVKEVRALSWSHFRWIMGAILGIIFTITSIFLKGHIG